MLHTKPLAPINDKKIKRQRKWRGHRRFRNYPRTAGPRLRDAIFLCAARRLRLNSLRDIYKDMTQTSRTANADIISQIAACTRHLESAKQVVAEHIMKGQGKKNATIIDTFQDKLVFQEIPGPAEIIPDTFNELATLARKGSTGASLLCSLILTFGEAKTPTSRIAIERMELLGKERIHQDPTSAHDILHSFPHLSGVSAVHFAVLELMGFSSDGLISSNVTSKNTDLKSKMKKSKKKSPLACDVARARKLLKLAKNSEGPSVLQPHYEKAAIEYIASIAKSSRDLFSTIYASYLLGFSFLYGIALKRNVAAGMRLINIAAEFGSPVAQALVGIHLEDSQNDLGKYDSDSIYPQKMNPVATMMASRSARSLQPLGMLMLGIVREKKERMRSAFKIYRKAAMLGCAESQRRHAELPLLIQEKFSIELERIWKILMNQENTGDMIEYIAKLFFATWVKFDKMLPVSVLFQEFSYCTKKAVDIIGNLCAYYESASDTTEDNFAGALKTIYLVVPAIKKHFDVCGICMSLQRCTPVIRVNSEAREHFQKPICSHTFCHPCMSSYVRINVMEGRYNIACPHPACSVKLFEDDVLAHAGPTFQKKFLTLKLRGHTQRLLDLKEEYFKDSAVEEGGTSKDTFTRLNEACRVCPSCSVVVFKSDGCRSMLCTCGETFDWGDLNCSLLERVIAVTVSTIE